MGTVQIIRKAAAPGLIVLGLALGLWGVRWGLPGADRLARVMPPGLDGPAFRQTLADSWSSMHAELGDNLMLNPKSFGSFTGVVETPAGWKTPPKELLNSFRSFYVRSEHEDEQSLLLALSRMKPKQLQFKPHLFTYGALHIYSVGAALAVGALLGQVSLKSSILFYLADPSKMAAMYLAGRLLGVASFIAGALMLLRLGRRAGFAAGLTGGAIYLMTPAAVVQAHVLKNHTFWSVFVLWTLERCAVVLERGRLKDYAAAGVVAGLTTATFLGAWPACLVVGAAGAMRLLGLHDRHGKPCKPLPELKGLVLAGACAIGAFLLVSPYWIIDFKEAMAEMKVLSGFSALDPAHAVLFVTHALRRSVTDPILVLMLGGTILALFKGKRDPFLLLCAVAVLIGLASMSTVGNVLSTRQVRYALGWLAIGSLLAGSLLQELRALKGPAGKLGALATAVALIGLFCQGSAYAYNFAVGTGERSNHAVAGEWIDKNVPAGATIGLLRYPQPSNSPFFRWDRYRLRFIEPKIAAGLPEKAWPAFLALTIPDYDDRSYLGPVLARYELLAAFPRAKLWPWVDVEATSTTANPLIEIYRLKGVRS